MRSEKSWPAASCESERLAAERLVERLNSLLDGEGVVSALVACGTPAIEPLRAFLLKGTPNVVYQPRRWAVDALAGLAAKDVLIEYLQQSREIPDPAIRLAEEAVENAAARHLAAWKSEDVFRALLKAAARRSRAGVIEGLGKFQRAEALPCFIKALEDDCCRAPAEEALRQLGSEALPVLIETCRTQEPSELPSSLRRRASAAEILSESNLPTGAWPLLRSLLDERDPSILVPVSRLAVRYGTHEDQACALRRLIEALPASDGFLCLRIEDILADLYPAHQRTLDAEFARRSALPDGRRVSDQVLRTLMRVRRRKGA